tara:strand:- start:661 stop:792 length:132 start_codon:yes stop_codon:yes gene_type:complete
VPVTIYFGAAVGFVNPALSAAVGETSAAILIGTGASTMGQLAG